MLGILLDAAVIVGLVSLVNDGDELDFTSAVICAILIVGASLGFSVAVDSLSLWVSLVAIIPLSAVFGLIIAVVTSIPVARAMIAGALFTGYRIVATLTFALIFGW